MLRYEALGLISQQEQNHDTPNFHNQSTAPAHDRRHEAAELSPRTQAGYLRAVRKLTRFLGHSPATATAEELRQFQLHLVDKGTSGITLNATVTALT